LIPHILCQPKVFSPFRLLVGDFIAGLKPYCLALYPAATASCCATVSSCGTLVLVPREAEPLLSPTQAKTSRSRAS
jgi:hypothetical protein